MNASSAPAATATLSSRKSRFCQRRHARLKRDPDGWRLEDLESTNATRINNRRIEGIEALMPGDRLQFGNVRAELRLGKMRPSSKSPLDSQSPDPLRPVPCLDIPPTPPPGQ